MATLQAALVMICYFVMLIVVNQTKPPPTNKHVTFSQIIQLLKCKQKEQGDTKIDATLICLSTSKLFLLVVLVVTLT